MHRFFYLYILSFDSEECFGHEALRETVKQLPQAASEVPRYYFLIKLFYFSFIRDMTEI